MKNGIIYTVLSLCLFWTFFLLNKNYILNTYQPRNLTVSFDIITSENDIFQLFYREPQKKFNEKFSETIRVGAADGIQKIEFHVPETLNISHLRFDFGNKFHESAVLINQVVFSSNGNKTVIQRKDLEKYFKPNKYAEASESGYLRRVIGSRSDPFFSSVNLQEMIYGLKQGANYSRSILNIILSLSLSLCSVIALHFFLARKRLEDPYVVAFTFLFFLILIIPHVDEVFELDDTATTEKRELLELPEINFADIEEYPNKFENFYNEKFGFRKKMVSLSATLKVKIFKTSPKSERVIVGKEGWLFYWKDVIKKSYLKENPFSSENLGDFGEKINEVNEFSKSQNSLFLTTIYPNKHTVYEEKIPERFRKLKRDNSNRIDEIYNFLKENSILNVDHRKLLADNSNKRALYLKNDSHWNSLGAYYAYKNIIAELFKRNSNIGEPLALRQFEIKTISDYKKGDLLDLLGIDNSNGIFNDTYIEFSPVKKIRANRKNNVYGKGSFVIDNLDAENEETILFFGDSFSNELLQFMPVHFKKTIFVRNINLDKNLIENINPSIIVYGIVERNLEYF